ncbi:glycosyltransferase family 2 protein [Bacteroidota bacterium]
MVSVIIPTYNREVELVEAIDSALGQTYDPIEVVVVDDGSDDNTINVVSGFSDSRLQYDRIDHAGPSVARNRGIEISIGDFIAFLDSDDIWYPLKLERQMPLFDDPEIGWTYTDLDYLGESGPEPRRFQRMKPCRGHVMRDLFLDGCPMLTTSVVLRRSCLDRTGLFDPELLRWQDNDLYYRLAASFKVDFIDEPLARYWHRARKRSMPDMRLARHRHRTVLRRAMALDPTLKQCSPEELRKAYLNNVFELGRLEYRARNRVEARRHFQECLSFQPSWWKPLVGYVASLFPALTKSPPSTTQ